jgi:hypothetical protein
VKAKIRAKVKRLLRRFGYSLWEILDIVPTIMEQAESLYRNWPLAA